MAVALWYLVLFAALHVPQLNHIFGYATNVSPDKILTQINDKRVQANLPPLRHNAQLATAAQTKATDMLAQGYWAHTAPSGEEPWDFIEQSGYHYSLAGENLAKNFQQTDTLIAAWMDSPTHRANILGTEYQDTGIAVVQGELQGVPTTLIVEMFGRPSDQPLLAAVSPQPGYAPYANEDQAAGVALLGTSITQRWTPLITPFNFYRLGLITLLLVLAGVLLHDSWWSQYHHRAVSFGRNLAHFLVVAGVIVTLVLARSGRLW